MCDQPQVDHEDDGSGPIGDDVELSLEDLRAVARYAAEAAQEVLASFERVRPDDPRPRAAIEAALVFAEGAPRSRRQRECAVDAHRAAKETDDPPAQHAARAAGDAAAAAYLHPLARASQVGHLLRAAAHAARAAELATGDPADADRALERARLRATPVVVEVLGRYPRAAASGGRVARLVWALDQGLRRERG